MDPNSGDITFPRAVRLHSPRQYQAVFSQGRRLNAALFRLHVHLHDNANAVDKNAPGSTAAIRCARLGISVPKRVAAHAVERNRIRRIVRECFRHLRHQLPPGDYVVVALREAAFASPSALRESLSGLWQRANALKLAGAAPTMPVPAPKPAAPDPSFPPPPQR